MSSRHAKDALFEAVASMGKAFASPRRLELIDLLAQGPRTVEELARATEQSTANTSQHLQALYGAGVVDRSREGTRVRYGLAGDDVIELWSALQAISAGRIAEVERAAREYLGEPVEAVTRDELVARLRKGDLVLVDVRPDEEFEAGHIDGAVSIPIDQLADRLAELPQDAEVIAYCRGPLCAYAHQAVRQLQGAGRFARRLEGGWPEWKLAQGDHEITEGRMTTKTSQLDRTELEQRVKGMYEEVALEPEHEFHFETGRPLAERLGYPVADLDRLPAGAVDSFAGVGYFLDLAGIGGADSVLDLGSGSGTDSFAAALRAARVVGVDMTDAQLDKARELAADGGFENVEFRHGYIEEPPVEGGSFDCVISNGVINLSPDKPAVFAAAARALRPGGRLALADIVSAKQLPEGVTCDASLWAACIGGAMQSDRYREAIEGAGFEIEAWRDNAEYRFVSERADNATQKYGVTSISLLAVRR